MEKGRTMREQIQARLEELKRELETGQAELQRVEMQRTYLRETVLRISGAVQVLEELLADAQRLGQDGAAPDQTQPAVVDQPSSGEELNDDRTRGSSRATAG